VKALDGKLLRDLGLAKGQAITIALVVACGIAAFVGARSAAESLVRTRDRYFAMAHFADVFATLERAPLPLGERIARIPGIAQSETRLVFDEATSGATSWSVMSRPSRRAMTSGT
jgi:putative ABC transport system permease protein